MTKKPHILVAEGSRDLLEKITSAPAHELYAFETATSGEEVFAKLESFQPRLLIIDLNLPHMHGIELLKKIKSDPRYEKVGIILTSTNSMVQNFHAAIKEGVDYFLARPTQIDFLYQLIKRYFEGVLVPEPFSEEQVERAPKTEPYIPKSRPKKNYLKFWGTRGSNAVSGPDYIRFGGNTVCLEVNYENDRIIIDAGTGIRPLGDAMMPLQNPQINLFLSHTHWDHVTGFPFFAPLYHPEVELILWSPVGFEKSTKELFTEMLAYAYFPVRLEDMQAKLSFKDLRDGRSVSIGGITVECHYAFHPGATLCFKIHVGGKTYGYATDNEMFLGYHGHPSVISDNHLHLKTHQRIIEFFRGCDFLIHEAQYTPQEYQRRVGWGHSSVSNAAILCKQAGIKSWIVTHHDPQHTDEFLLEKCQMHKDIFNECHYDCSVTMAFDGMKLPL